MRYFKKKEDGDMVDMMGSVLVLIFVFGMVLAYFSYSKMIQMKMSIDNIAKEYLYQMEESGQFTTAMQNSMKAELQALGCTVNNFTGTSPTGATQAGYGSVITLKCSVTFPNPLYTNLGTASHTGTFDFVTIATNANITYTIERKSVARY